MAFTGKKNPNYYRAGEPHVDEVIGQIIPDTATQMAALRGKELDYVEVPQQELESMRRTNPEIQIVDVEQNLLSVHLLAAWTSRRSTIRGCARRSRWASIATSASRSSTAAAATTTTSSRWRSPSGGSIRAARSRGRPRSSSSTTSAEAKKLLAEAGYPNGFKVDLVSTPGYGQVWVQAGRADAPGPAGRCGIDATIKMQEYAAYLATTFQGKLPEGENVIVYGLETPFTEPHDFLFNMYHPRGTRNHAAVNDAKLTEMIEKQMRTVDKAERKKQIYEIQRYLGEQMYYPQATAGFTSNGACAERARLLPDLRLRPSARR